MIQMNSCLQRSDGIQDHFLIAVLFRMHEDFFNQSVSQVHASCFRCYVKALHFTSFFVVPVICDHADDFVLFYCCQQLSFRCCVLAGRIFQLFIQVLRIQAHADLVQAILGAEHVNVQPHSGAQANAAVLLAVLKPGDTFMGMNLDHGGHLSHGSHVNTSGILYKPVGYNLKKETGRVDYDEMEQLAIEHKPKLIIGGGSAYSREWDYKRMREIADKVGALLMIDMAHPAGLIAAGLLDNPVKYAHIVTSTTHKTLRGPRGGIILMGKDFENPWGLTTPKGQVKMMSQILNSAVFPGQQGGPLEHVIAAKAVAFGEALQPEFKEWAKQVQKNAQVLAEELVKRGFGIVSGGTDNHSMLVDLRSKYPELTGKVAENALVAADITVNKNMVPFDTRSAFQTSGIRLGTPAITTRGVKEDMMPVIADLIEEVLNAPENEKVIASVRARVNEMMKDYPLFAY